MCEISDMTNESTVLFVILEGRRHLSSSWRRMSGCGLKATGSGHGSVRGCFVETGSGYGSVRGCFVETGSGYGSVTG
jgi:hypothetical protein